MTILRKDIVTTLIPGNPAITSSPGTPYIPAHYVIDWYTEYVWSVAPTKLITVFVPCGSPPVSGEVSRGSCYVSKDMGRIANVSVSVPNTTPSWIPMTLPHQVYVPEQLATPSVPASPATLTQINVSNNTGWNSWSTTSGGLSVGTQVKFRVATGSEGVIIGVGTRRETDVKSINNLKHAIVSDVGGIRVMESGVVVTTLRASSSSLTEVRIFRNPDNTISYLLVTGNNDHIQYDSGVSLGFSGTELYANCFLYSAGDNVTEASIDAGQIQYGVV